MSTIAMSPEFSSDQLVEMALVASPSGNGASTPAVDTVSCPPLPGSARVDETLGASASQWLDEYIRFSRIWSPRSYDGFHEAVALWVLSTVAAGRIRVHLGRQRFPALYIALCSRTSLHAKSSATEIGRDLLIDAGLDWLLLPDSVTPQRFIQEMAGLLPKEYANLPPYQQHRIKMRLALSGKRGWYYEEFGEKLAAMMRQNGTMADFRGHLRRLDDGLPSYEYGTIMRGTERIEGPYLALLANLTPADLRPYAQPNGPLWHDGFFARFAFIAPPNTAERSRGTFPKGQRLFPDELLQPLKAWHQRLGMPDVNVEASPGDASPHWKLAGDYHPTTCILGEGVLDAFYQYHDALLDIAQGSWRTDLDGNYARFAEKALRVSMLLASLGNNDVIGQHLRLHDA